ncbi:MAG: FAD-dependent oxidoreductase, partial [Rhodospirillales bacterium]
MKPSEWTWNSASAGVDTDVVVVGGGMSGIAAALAARRSGCRVLLAERHGFLGGAATAGSVAQFVGWATRAGRRVVRGIAGEIADRLEAAGGAAGFDVFTMSTGHRMDRLQYDPEILKVVLDTMLLEAGVTVLFHCALADIAANDGRVSALRIATQKGALEIRGTVFIDASGDMALLDAAGARFLERQPEGLQPATMMFAIATVDFAEIAALDDARRNADIEMVQASGDLPRAA